MPFPIKLSLSILVVLVASVAFWAQGRMGHVGPQYAVGFLALFVIVGMWIFPEVKREGR